jgi:hypothetical protein
MKNRSIVLAFVFASITAAAPVAHAQLNLAWNNCITQGTAAADKAYACDGSANGTAFRAVMSFLAPANLDHFVAITAGLDVRASTLPTLPDYWKLGVGECRDGNFAFPVSLTGIGTGTTGVCRNPWAGGGLGGGFSYTSETRVTEVGPVPAPGWGRMVLAFARDTEAQLIQGQQYVAGAFTLDTFNDVDTGGGVCAGCALPACIVFNSLELNQTAGSPGGDIFILTTPATRAFVTWQGGAVGGNGCPLEVPVRNVTWGRVKSIYR